MENLHDIGASSSQAANLMQSKRQGTTFMVIPCLYSFLLTVLRTLAAEPPINKKRTRTLSRKESGSSTNCMVGGTGLEQQRRRPPPAAETGSRGWDSVLIFQSPAKGLRKNQQTQPVQAPAVRFRQGSQRLGMSTGMTAVLWWAVQGESRNEQRQGITMVVVYCLLLFLIEYGILGSVQQICIWRIESCGMN
jgi:hypothetical protein